MTAIASNEKIGDDRPPDPEESTRLLTLQGSLHAKVRTSGIFSSIILYSTCEASAEVLVSASESRTSLRERSGQTGGRYVIGPLVLPVRRIRDHWTILTKSVTIHLFGISEYRSATRVMFSEEIVPRCSWCCLDSVDVGCIRRSRQLIEASVHVTMKFSFRVTVWWMHNQWWICHTIGSSWICWDAPIAVV